MGVEKGGRPVASIGLPCSPCLRADQRMKAFVLLISLLLLTSSVTAGWGDTDSDGDGQVDSADEDDDNDGLLDVEDDDDDGDGVQDEDEDNDGDGLTNDE